MESAADNGGSRTELVTDIGRYIVGSDPDVIVCLGLGSCVGVAIYDPVTRIGGMMHVMLPLSSSDSCINESIKEKYADVGIPKMLQEMMSRGCAKHRLIAKIAGGAHMFKNIVDSDTMDIGAKNIDAVRKVMSELDIRISAEDVAGNIGRTMRIYTDTGKIIVKSKDSVKEL